MIHPNEPTLEELISIRSTLYGQESTDVNVKKCKALESQIERHKADRDAKKAPQKTSETEE